MRFKKRQLDQRRRGLLNWLNSCLEKVFVHWKTNQVRPKTWSPGLQLFAMTRRRPWLLVPLAYAACFIQSWNRSPFGIESFGKRVSSV